MTGIDVLDKILPLIGVLIGVLMSPWVIHRIEKGKRKDSLKYQLIESIYLMSKLVQVHSNSCNLYWFYHQRLEVMRVKIPTHSTIARDEIEVSKYNEKMHNSYDALSEIEAKIISMKVEVRDHYSHKKISQLNNF